MKINFHIGFFITLLGILVFGCKKGDDQLQITNQFSNENSLNSVPPTGQFSFDNYQLAELEEDLDLFAKALTYVSSNETLLQLLFNQVSLLEQDEEISIEELEVILTPDSIDLWTLLSSALAANQHSPSEISQVHEVYKNFSMNNISYTTYIHIPFTDSVNFNNKPYFTSQVKAISDLNELKVYSRNLSGGIQSEQIDKAHAQNSPVIFISVISDDHEEYTALPWSWCECTRSTSWYENGQIHISTIGDCVNRGECSRCGRSDFQGNCRSDSCPGC